MEEHVVTSDQGRMKTSGGYSTIIRDTIGTAPDTKNIAMFAMRRRFTHVVIGNMRPTTPPDP